MRKSYFTLILSLLATGLLSAQNFEKTLSRANTDYNHYSVETAQNGDLILAGTLFENGNNSIHVVRMDASGNVLCEQKLNFSADDRALDVMEDPNQRMVVTGYTTSAGIPELIIAQFNSSCACQQNVTVTGVPAGAGTNIIWSDNSQSYIVGGMRADQFTNPMYDNYAVLLEIDPSSLLITNSLELRGPDHHHASINDIIEMPNGYFVTGSIDDGIQLQGVLAAWVDFNLNLSHHVSFESTNSQHVGVSAVYDSGSDNIYLMSNNSAWHNPQITRINGASGSTPSIGGHFIMALDPNYGPTNASGFELRQSIYNSNNLVAAGNFRTHGGSQANNAAPWLTEFNKNSGAHVRTIINNAPSTNFHAHGGGTFSTYNGVHPRIFNQEILTVRPDGAGYIYLGPRTVNGRYGLEVISTDFDHTVNDCLDHTSWSPQSLSAANIALYDDPATRGQSEYLGFCSSISSTVEDLCSSGTSCVSQSFQRTVSQPGTNHNHYSIETISNCEYVVAGTEFKNGDNDIHVFKMDGTGNMLWERYLDNSFDDRALDITEDANGDLIVVGYISSSGTAQMYIAKMTANGNFINDATIGGYANSALTNVIYSSASNTYIAGGMGSGNFGVPLTNSKALVMEFDANLNYTGNAAEFFGPFEEAASVNDIVEVSNGFFVTGSHDYSANGIHRQGVLAVFLDNNLAVTSQNSFQSTNHEHVGVSAVYDNVSDELYLMSNNSVIHNPQITTFGDIQSGSPIIVNDYFLELDPTYGTHDASGFKLIKTPMSSNRLTAAGYFRSDYPGMQPMDNATTWIADFHKSSGTAFNSVIYTPPSMNFPSHGNGVFSTFQNEHAYIFNQEILTNRADDNGLVFLAPRLYNSRYAVDVVSMNMLGSGNSCMTYLKYDPFTRNSFSIPTTVDFPSLTVSNISVGFSPENSFLTMECMVSPKQANEQFDALEDATGITVYPNPTSDQITVSIPSGLEVNGSIQILNALGEVVITTTLGSDQTAVIDLSTQESGLYFVIYSADDQRIVSKVMKH